MGAFLAIVAIVGAGVGVFIWVMRLQRSRTGKAVADAVRQFGLKPAEPVHPEEFDEIWNHAAGKVRDIPVAVTSGLVHVGRNPVGLAVAGIAATGAPIGCVRVVATYPKPLAHELHIARRGMLTGTEIETGDAAFQKVCTASSPAPDEFIQFLGSGPLRKALTEFIGHPASVAEIGQHEIRVKVFDATHAPAFVRECASLALRLQARASELGWPVGPPPPPPKPKAVPPPIKPQMPAAAPAQKGAAAPQAKPQAKPVAAVADPPASGGSAPESPEN